MSFTINIYSDDCQFALRYLKNTEVNLNNVLIMIEYFNIRDNDWNLLYPHHLTYANILKDITDFFNLELSTPIIQVSIKYANNSQESNLVIDLMFIYANGEEFDKHMISSNLCSSSDHALLSTNIIIKKNFI